MAERKNTYTNMTDRRAAIKLAESEGWVLENDNHLDNGTKELIFTDSPDKNTTVDRITAFQTRYDGAANDAARIAILAEMVGLTP